MHKLKKSMLGVLVASILLSTPLQAKITYTTYSDEIEIVKQSNTGRYSETNCGIASLKVALNYLGVESGSVSSLREEVRPYSGYVYTNELEDYLKKEDVEYRVQYLRDKNVILNALDEGIVILCLDMNKVSHVNYSGHFIVLTGKIVMSDKVIIEAYDSMYSRVQYYDLDSLMYSAESWWQWCFTFSEKDKKHTVVTDGVETEKVKQVV